MAVKKKAVKRKTVKRKTAKKKVAKRKARKKAASKSTIKRVALQKVESSQEETPEEEKNPGFKFPKGNKYWQCRAKHGRDGIWSNAEDLLQDCISYFEWLEKNPLFEEKGFAFQGVVTKERFAKMRAATIDGLCVHLGIGTSTWALYKKRPDFMGVCSYTEQMIRDQKFAGASADLLNASIIARDLGLKDTVESRHTDKDGENIPVMIYIPANGRNDNS